MVAALLVLFSITAFAKETVIKGKITDAESNDALPFVNIFFKGTTIGVTSDFDGYYELRTTQNMDSISVSGCRKL